MSRRPLSVAAGAATAALIAATLSSVPATATPSADDPAAPAADKADDREDTLEAERRELTQEATELVLSGDRQVQDRGGSQAVRVAPGQWAQYGQEDSDNILTFLVEFGDQQDARFPDAPVGPLHNQIPKPDRSVDNSTYWTSDFNRGHFEDMFFGATGESFTSVYEELSSGRYTIGGDVSDWVRVPHNEASYGETESQTDMTRFIDDSAEAWYAQQKAAGTSDAEIKAYLADFDQWDRFDWDKDGDFSEADGYIDHFQAVHAGEDESAGAPSWAIWAHRWAVNQSRTYKDGAGPAAYAQNGGVEIGDTGLWIRDYTTEPENGGLGRVRPRVRPRPGPARPLRHRRRRERHRLLDPDELGLVARPRRGQHRHHAQPHGRLGEAAARLARLRGRADRHRLDPRARPVVPRHQEGPGGRRGAARRTHRATAATTSRRTVSTSATTRPSGRARTTSGGA